MPQQDISFDTFKSFIDHVEGLEAIELQGEGEPLLTPHFFDMVAYAREKFPQLEISMITNGSMFSKKNIESLLDHNIARIFISVESVNDDDFKRIRGGKLERVRNGVKALKATRDQRGLRHPVLGLAVTVLRSTAQELADNIPAFYEELGLDGGATIQQLQEMPQYSRFYDEATRNELINPQAAQLANRAFQQSSNLQKIMSDRFHSQDTGFYEKLFSSVDSRSACPWLSNGIFMSTAGQLMPCCMTKDYQADALGHIFSLTDAPSEPQNRLLEKRASMQRQLKNGQIPLSCSGCTVASQIVRNNS